LGDEKVMEFSVGGPMSRHDAGVWLGNRIEDYKKNNESEMFAVLEKRSGTLIGYCCLTLFPDIDGVPEVEVGYRLIPAVWGNGYATEAARAVRDHAFTDLGVTRLIAMIEPNNKRSIRVAEKLGMKYEKEVMLEGYDHPDNLYSMVKQE